MPSRDFDLLASRILSFAKKALGDGGSVIPLGAAISLEGEFRPIQRIYAPNQKIAAPDLAEEIVGIFRNLARDKQARSVAWCVAMQVVPPGATENIAGAGAVLRIGERRIEQADHAVPGRARADDDVRAAVSAGPPAEGLRGGVGERSLLGRRGGGLGWGAS